MRKLVHRGGHFALATVLAAANLLTLSAASPNTTGDSIQSADSSGEATTYESPQQRRRGGFGGPIRGVYKMQISAHWLAGDARFWYRNDLSGGTKEFILVDAEKGTRGPAFDHARLAAALSRAAGGEFKADRLPFQDIEFVNDGKAIQFSAATNTWRCDLKSYQCVQAPAEKAMGPSIKGATESAQADSRNSDAVENASPADDENLSPQQAEAQQQDQGTAQGRGRGARAGRGAGGGGRGFGRGFNRGPVTSPDGKWAAFVTNYNVFVRPASGGDEVQLSHDGETNDYYTALTWAPDSQSLVAWREQPGDEGLVYLVQSSPRGGGRAIMTSRPYAQAGDKYALCEVNVFDIASMKQVKPNTDRWTDGNYGSSAPPGLRWEKDQRHFTYEFVERGHQRWRLVEVDSRTGDVRNLVDEKSKDFIWTAHADTPWAGGNGRGNSWPVRWLPDDEFIYVSEMDGWEHLYFGSAKDGGIKNQITKGEWAVRGVDLIDETNRQIWFQASGRNPGEDVYDIHCYRINFDGTGMVELTGGDGTHSVEYSPERKYLIDTYSHVDVPPVHTLRRASDGKFICKLEETDISELRATGWRPSEPFVAKGRDGKTDIYGTITWPANMDPSRKYPVLENIYAGPQMASVQHGFSAGGARGTNGYGSQGFIVVQIDGMGTPHRSHAFHAVCWQHLGRDNGFPDRILWHKAVAAKYPAYDITRVGIFGTSAGGQSAAAAVIFHPEFYRVAVANSGCHDNRIDKASWNEQWMGYMPSDKIWSDEPDNWFSLSSNIDNAAKLGGKLLLIVGEMDDNVPPESTYRLVDGLIKARKDFDLLVVPGANHGAGSPITQRKTQDYFVHNLLGREPMDYNSPAMETSSN